MLKPEGYNETEGLMYKNQYHIIFCPKYRRKVLVDGVEERLREILAETAQENNIVLNAIEIMPNYVHLFIEIDPRMAVHVAVRALKANTSRILRDEFPCLKSKLPSLWTRHYFCCTVGKLDDETINLYVISQKNK